MKISSNYKIYIKSNKIIDNFPQKIKNFHRSKWKWFLRQNRYKIKRYKFKNFFSRSFPKGIMKFIIMKKYYKKCLLQKIHLQQMYNNSFNFKRIKKDLSFLKNLTYTNLSRILLVKHLFFLNILLWKLHFFCSTLEASHYINNNCVFVNKKVVSFNYLLKKGDIITFKESLILNFRKNLNKYKFFPNFYSFIEIDYYTCTIIIIKDFDSFTMDDYTTTFSKPFNISYVYNNIK